MNISRAMARRNAKKNKRHAPEPPPELPCELLRETRETREANGYIEVEDGLYVHSFDLAYASAPELYGDDE